MKQVKSDPLETFDSFVAAFESACKDGSSPDLRAFLPPTAHPLRIPVLSELVRVDLEWNWSLGRRCGLDDYRSIVPELFDHPSALGEAAFEEYRQRCLASELVDPDEYARRYHISTGDWPRFNGTRNAKDGSTEASRNRNSSRHGSSPGYAVDDAETLHVAVDLVREQPSALPSIGDEFLGFTLQRELGRGTFARVFLARQEALADRPVALKVSLNLMGEHKKLARLQHAHVVPIYSIHEHHHFQAICMPYFGGFTLDRLMTRLKSETALPASAKVLVEMLSEDGSTNPETSASGTSPRDRFAEMKFGDAIAWIGARLAEGLAHAHDRGLIHRDLKPANVLLTGDGQPMLLDFNVAQSIDDAAARAGGSLMYMSPEQLIAYRNRINYAKPGSDLYSLGLVLYELLTGQHPFPISPHLEADKISRLLMSRRFDAPSIRSLNPAISAAVEAIVLKLIHPDPTRRHNTARQLQEDLDAHLANRPLPHTQVHSRRERTRKWLRRNPRLTVAAASALAVAVFVLIPATTIAIRRQQVIRAEAQNLFAKSRDDLRDAEYFLTDRQDETHDREIGSRLGRDVLNRYGVLTDSNWKSQSKMSRLPDMERRQLTQEIGEMLALLAQRDEGDHRPETTEVSLQMTDRAVDCLGAGSPRGLRERRGRLLNELGRPAEADPLPESAGEPSEFEGLMDAYELIETARFREALVKLEAIARRNPANYQAWITAGHCHFCLGAYQDAKACFTVCIALRPDSPWANFNRGMLFVRTQNFSEAISDLNRALEKRPDFTDALIDRAIAKQKTGDLKGAEADLNHALDCENAPTRAYFRRAEVRRLAGNQKGAEADWKAGLQNPPLQDADRMERGLVQMETEPKAALADFNAVLKNNPRNRDGLQNKAHVLAEHLNRTREAVETLDRLLAIYPDFLPALGGRGVYHGRLGNVAEARHDAAKCYLHDRSPFGLYQQASLFGVLAGRDPKAKDDALRLLTEALQSGFADLKLIEADTDMNPVRNDPEFRRLMTVAKELHRPAQNP